MQLFQQVKEAVPLREAAQRYGLQVGRNGMTCCPFHEDRHPSLKLNEDYFYCFGCGAHGDVIDFVARLFDLGLRDAAGKLAADFGVRADGRPAPVRRNSPRADELRFRRALRDYLLLLGRWKLRYAPRGPQEQPQERFITSCQQSEHIAGLLEMLDVASPTQRSQTAAALIADGTVQRWEAALEEDRKEQDHANGNPHA